MDMKLSKIWLESVAKEAGYQVPPYILSLAEIMQPMSALAIEDFKSSESFTYKDDNTPCGIDEKIELLFKDHIHQTYPTHYVMGEETEDETPDHPEDNDCRWVIDPIDGTRNNEYGRDDFAISIARQLYRDDTWQSVDALLISPVRGEILFASEGMGTHMLSFRPYLDTEPVLQQIHVDQIGRNKPLDKSLIDLATHPLSAHQQADLTHIFKQAGITTRDIGSSAVALGQSGLKYDGAIVMANDYDVAAGRLIAKETGCVVSEFNRGSKVLVVIGINQKTHDVIKQFCDLALELK